MLVISTATKKAYIGIDYNGHKYYSQVEADCRQSENILQEIDNLLQKNNIALKDIGNIGVVIGPGSFTGIRIGVALVKGLCAGDSSHKVVPISTLDLMAKTYLTNYVSKDSFACVINALSGRVFYAKYNKSGKKLSIEQMISDEKLLLTKEDKVVLQEEYPKLIGIELNSQVLLDYALELESKKKFVEADKLTPVYIRKSQAEENLE